MQPHVTRTAQQQFLRSVVSDGRGRSGHPDGLDGSWCLSPSSTSPPSADGSTPGRGAAPVDRRSPSTSSASATAATGSPSTTACPGIASSSPAVLIAHLAAATTRLRVGSGGVMLPNHSPLVIAEQFGTLEALHPGRIDLGIGRAPGTDQITAYALRRSMHRAGRRRLPRAAARAARLLRRPDPRVHAAPGRRATPRHLAAGLQRATARSSRGLARAPVRFAHHFSRPEHARRAGPVPHAVPARRCGSTRPTRSIGGGRGRRRHRRARPLPARAGALSFLRLRTGSPGRFPTPEEAAAYEFSPPSAPSSTAGRPRTSSARRRRCARLRRPAVERTNADELMVTTMIHDHADRLRSYELLAEAVAPAVVS